VNRRIYIYVNGILNFPGGAKNWVGRAVTFTHIYSTARAEKIEYLSFATLSRLLGQRNRSKKLARTLSFYEGWDIRLVGHSNGCAVILDALRYLDWPPVTALFFFSPACEEDCRKNGLYEYMKSGRLGMLTVFMAGKDLPLRWAASAVGRLFGYGAMGIRGPIGSIPEKTRIVRRSEWGHSDWWTDWNFEWSMKQVLNYENPPCVGIGTASGVQEC